MNTQLDDKAKKKSETVIDKKKVKELQRNRGGSINYATDEPKKGSRDA